MEWLWKRFRGFLVKRLGTTGGVIAWAGALVVVLLLGRIADWLTRGWIDKHVVEPAVRAFVQAAGAPIGAVLLVLLLAFFLLNSFTFGLAWFDTTETAAKLRGARPKLGLEERADVDQVRRFWKAEPHAACERAISAFDSAVHVLQARNEYWATLLYTPRNKLHEATRQFGIVLKSEGSTPLIIVLASLKAVADAYTTCAIWHYRLRHQEADLFTHSEGGFNESDYEHWKKLHTAFAKRSNDLRRGESFEGHGVPWLDDDLGALRGIDDPPPHSLPS